MNRVGVVSVVGVCFRPGGGCLLLGISLDSGSCTTSVAFLDGWWWGSQRSCWASWACMPWDSMAPPQRQRARTQGQRQSTAGSTTPSTWLRFTMLTRDSRHAATVRTHMACTRWLACAWRSWRLAWCGSPRPWGVAVAVSGRSCPHRDSFPSCVCRGWVSRAAARRTRCRTPSSDAEDLIDVGHPWHDVQCRPLSRTDHEPGDPSCLRPVPSWH